VVQHQKFQNAELLQDDENLIMVIQMTSISESLDAEPALLVDVGESCVLCLHALWLNGFSGDLQGIRNPAPGMMGQVGHAESRRHDDELTTEVLIDSSQIGCRFR
jgi:hypothetical protein